MANPNEEMVEALQALTAATNAIAQVVQDIQQVQQGAPPGGGVVGFHLSPFAAMPQGQLIDYTSKEGRKFYEQATRSLFPKDEYFDVEPNKFQTLISHLSAWAKDLGFTANGGVAMVPEDAANPGAGNPIDTINDYGTASMEQITAWERTFLAQQGRPAQDSKILFEILMNTLSTQGVARVTIWRSQWMLTIENHP
jgi:hypothetical protein